MSATELLDAPSTTIAKAQPINWELLREQALSTFDIQKEEISKEIAIDTKIVVTNDETREDANKVRMKWVRRRTGLDRTRKAASEDAKKIVALVKEVAETFQTQFDIAEQHLQKQIDDYDERIEKAKREAIEAAFAAKNDRLVAAGLTMPRILVDSMSDIDIDDKISEAVELARFRKDQADKDAAEKLAADLKAKEEAETLRKQQAELKEKQAAFDKQQAEQAALTAKLMAEHEAKLAAERAEFERQKAEQAAEMAKLREAQQAQQRAIEAEQKRLADIEAARIEAEQKAERDRLAEVERVRIEAEQKELARLEAEAEKQRELDRRELERAKAEQAEKDAEAARVLAEQLKPDREKLLAFAQRINDVADSAPDAGVLSVHSELAQSHLYAAADELTKAVM